MMAKHGASVLSSAEMVAVLVIVVSFAPLLYHKEMVKVISCRRVELRVVGDHYEKQISVLTFRGAAQKGHEMPMLYVFTVIRRTAA